MLIAQQAQDALSVGETLVIASIPATIALVGVIVTVAVGQRQAAKATEEQRIERRADRDHEARLERDQFLRAERIDAYRLLIRQATEVLLATTFAVMWSSEDRTTKARVAVDSLTEALALTQLVGAQSVLDHVANGVERVMMERFVRAERASRVVGSEGAPEQPYETVRPLFHENDHELQALVKVCRADIASLED